MKKKLPLVLEDSNLATVDYPVYENNPEHNLPILEVLTRRVYEEFLDQKKYKTLNLICTGSSGSFIAGVMMTLLKYRYDSAELSVIATHISKVGEQKHDECSVVFHNLTFNVIVDDFICSGETVVRIFNDLEGVEIHGLAVTGSIGANLFDGDQINKNGFWEKVKDLKFIICRKLINARWTS